MEPLEVSFRGHANNIDAYPETLMWSKGWEGRRLTTLKG